MSNLLHRACTLFRANTLDAPNNAQVSVFFAKKIIQRNVKFTSSRMHVI